MEFSTSTDTRIPDADLDVSNIHTTSLDLHHDVPSTEVTIPQTHPASNIDGNTLREDPGGRHRAVSLTRTLPVTG